MKSTILNSNILYTICSYIVPAACARPRVFTDHTQTDDTEFQCTRDRYV